MLHRRMYVVLALVCCGLLLVLVAGAVASRGRITRWLKDEVVRGVETAFDGHLSFEELRFSVGMRIRIQGKKLVFRQDRSEDLPPLFSADAFSVEAGIVGLLRAPRRIRRVTLTGLVIHVPPGKEREQMGDGKSAGSPPAAGQHADSPGPALTTLANVSPFLLERVDADGARLVIHPEMIDREPLAFDLYRLTCRSARARLSMTYEAVLRNARPPGLVNAKGEFGPWCIEDPGDTHLSGSYTVSKADRSVYRGVSGTLISSGGFRGVLRRVEAWGSTDTPDFTVRVGTQPVPLQTEFRAIVDGATGNMLVRPITARFGASKVVCHGGVYQTEGTPGTSVAVDAKMEDGRIEDVLRLVVPGEPPLVGGLSFSSKMQLPPGDQDVIDSLQVQGTFVVDHATFEGAGVQEKVDDLSHRSRGQLEDSTDERIVSDLQGVFVVEDAVVRFSKLSFSVPGARVSLEGQYGLVRQTLDFEGTLFMDAKISDTQKGVTSILLKVVDPFLAGKNAGTELPIKITGTRADPTFSLNPWGSKKKQR